MIMQMYASIQPTSSLIFKSIGRRICSIELNWFQESEHHDRTPRARNRIEQVTKSR